MSGQSTYTGKAQVRPLLETVLAQHTRGEFVGLPRVVGDRVKARVRPTSDNLRRLGIDTLEEDMALVVRDGKIDSGVHVYTPESVAWVAAARQAAAQAAAVQTPRTLPRTGDGDQGVSI